MREMQDQITFLYKEWAALKDEEDEMVKFNENQKEKLDMYKELEAENQRRDQELRKMIKEEKQEHR